MRQPAGSSLLRSHLLPTRDELGKKKYCYANHLRKSNKISLVLLPQLAAT